MAAGPAFPPGGREMGALVRGHDWAATPLGPMEGWPPALCLALATCLNTRAVAAIYWGPEFRLPYNDAYAPFLAERHHWALGRSMAEVWPTLWGALTAQVAHVLATGEGTVAANQRLPLDRGDGVEETVWFYSFAPILGGDGQVGGVLLTALDTTAQARREQALRAASERQTFRLKLEERLRGLADPGEVIGGASEALGRQLGAGQVAYGEVDATGDLVTIVNDWSDGSFAPINGRHRLADYGPAFVAEVRQGLTIAIGDVRLDGRTATPEALPSFARIGLAAFINVPLVKEGRLVAILAVHDGSPRPWSSDEVALAEAVAERTWSAAGRARAEATLRDSEARYRQIVEGAEDFAIVTLDAHGVVTGWNTGAERIVGVPREEAIGRQEGFFTPEDRSAGVPDHELKRAASVERSVNERWHLRGDGTRFWGSGLIMRLEAGGYLKMFRDRTAEHEAEAALRRSEERYRTLFEAIDAGFCIVEVRLDADGRGVDHRLVEVNPAFERQTGLHNAAGKWVSEIAPGMEGHWSEAYGRVALTGEAVRFENEARPLGRWYDVHVFRTGAPEERRVAVLFNDITARRQAEWALHELNETLEARVAERTAELDRVWRNSLDLLVVADAEGTFRAVSPAWTRILGYAETETVGRSFRDFVWTEDVKPTQVAVDATAAGGDANGFENRYRHKDGSPRRIAWRTSAERGLIYGYGRHVTVERRREEELAQAQEQLRQSQKMEAMGSFTGGVAQDFNHLLTPIIGSLDRLVTRRVSSKRERQLMAGALESAERAETLVQRLLAFARRQPLQPVAVDVATLVEDMSGLIGSTLGPTVEVQLDLAPDLPPAKGRATDDRGVARERAGPATFRAEARPLRPPRGGRHRHRHRHRHGRAHKPARRGALFSTKAWAVGTGLGLSMVHGLAAQLRGGLTIDSTPGQGTTVALWLPVSTEVLADVATDPAALRQPQASGRALLGDDEDLVRMSTADMLTDLGFEVLEADSAERALSLLREGANIDLLVTDHLMAGMSGADLAEEARVLRPSLPALIVSGCAEVEGIDPDLPRLLKPFRQAELAEHVAVIMPHSTPAR